MTLYGGELAIAVRNELARKPDQSAPEICRALGLGGWRRSNVRSVLLDLVANEDAIRRLDGRIHRFRLTERKST